MRPVRNGEPFILAHLGEPGLDPAAIAAAHHISRCYLHRLFQYGVSPQQYRECALRQQVCARP
ncbi:hypothetical protein DMB66_16320 [Actinoplanes sp. ATCC 53533]|uniref:AraC family transcriptional regulator n=1 Tax=Actinoplanes sp. ATCC 53533 TaxID=1288362 RepID=UPI000F770D94|nr:AraC family transcriptional regulator [Actinoplanes sp. ATCC 53533]RSM65416.1 hypothetical protein DMB66_16320 [Actinoplanes sp. ATCC 53533]